MLVVAGALVRTGAGLFVAVEAWTSRLLGAARRIAPVLAKFFNNQNYPH